MFLLIMFLMEIFMNMLNKHKQEERDPGMEVEEDIMISGDR